MVGLQVGIVETAAGPVAIFAAAADLAAWSPVSGDWSLVTLKAAYAPAQHPLLPSRGCNKAGELAAYPLPEANAIVAAGFGTAAGAAAQTGVGKN